MSHRYESGVTKGVWLFVRRVIDTDSGIPLVIPILAGGVGGVEGGVSFLLSTVNTEGGAIKFLFY